MRSSWLSALIVLVALPLAFASSTNEYVTWTALAKLFAVLTFFPVALSSLIGLLSGNILFSIAILVGGAIEAAIVYFLVLFLKNYLS